MEVITEQQLSPQAPLAPCQICNEAIAANTDTMCSFEHVQPMYCSNCLKEYVERKIADGFRGFCPRIKCPGNHDKNDACNLDFNKWSAVVGAESVKQYNQFAESILSILCGSCHKQSTCLVKVDPSKSIATQDELAVESKAALAEDLELYAKGRKTANDFYEKLLSLIPELNSGEDVAAWKIIETVLNLIHDPERRASLQLRHFKSRPRMQTACCKNNHCWNCKTKSHDGVNCEAHNASLDHSVVPCPQCG